MELILWPRLDSTYEEPEHEGSPRRNLERAGDPRFRGFMRAVGAPVVPLPESPTPPSGKLRNLWLYIFYFLVTVIISGTGALVIWLIIKHCSIAPEIALEEFTILDMAVFHNITTSSTPWQLTTDINLTLLTANRNTLAGCSTSLRRMDASVYYKGFLILASEIPAARFSLKHKKMRAVLAELKGERFQMADKFGPMLKKELFSDNVTLALEIDTRYEQLFSPRRFGKLHSTLTTCQVVAKTPLRSNSRPGSLLTKNCDHQRF